MVSCLLEDKIESKISQQRKKNHIQEEHDRLPDPLEFREKSKPEKSTKHEFIVDEANGGTLRIKTMNYFAPNKFVSKDNYLDRLVNMRCSEDVDAELIKIANSPNKYFQDQEKGKSSTKPKPHFGKEN